MFDCFIKGIHKNFWLLYFINFLRQKEKKYELMLVFLKLKLSEFPEASPFRSPSELHPRRTEMQEFTALPDPHMTLLYR